MHYKLNGLSLKDFCNLNNIDYKTIIGRINRIKKKLKLVNINDIFIIALNDNIYYRYFRNYNKYFYKNIPLSIYCKENNLDYSVISNRIRILKKRYPQFIEERIIRIAINDSWYNEMKDQNNSKKYFYNNETLYKYCEKNNLEYKKMLARVKSLKNIFKECSTEEIVRITADDNFYKSLIEDIELQRNNYSYYYDDYPLTEYCKINNIDINNIYHRIDKLKSKFPNYSNSEIIEIALNDDLYFKAFNRRNHNKFSYYNNITLKRYCKLNKIDYSILLNTILKLNEQYINLEENEIIELALGLYYGNKEYSDKIKYTYQKKLLISLKNILEKNNKQKELTKS